MQDTGIVARCRRQHCAVTIDQLWSQQLGNKSYKSAVGIVFSLHWNRSISICWLEGGLSCKMPEAKMCPWHLILGHSCNPGYMNQKALQLAMTNALYQKSILSSSHWQHAWFPSFVPVTHQPDGCRVGDCPKLSTPWGVDSLFATGRNRSKSAFFFYFFLAHRLCFMLICHVPRFPDLDTREP